MLKIKENALTYGRGYTYKIQYHIVWCVKYRRNVLTGVIEDDLKQMLTDITNELGITISAIECMPDHIHLLVNCSPQHFIPTVIKVLKGKAARQLFVLHPDLKNKLWDGHLWNPSYFIATVSENTEQEIAEYINSQKTK